MRITGGTLRGRNLVTPPDARVRPTSDKVRQAIFNILMHNDFGAGFTLEGAKVCDLFAGTGALGIEALGLTGVTKIWRRDATDLGPLAAGSGGPFELAFLDPPYRKNLVAPALAALRGGGWLSRNAIVVIETGEDEIVTLPDGFSMQNERVYGDTRVWIFVASGARPV